jgi:hypothetical protein
VIALPEVGCPLCSEHIRVKLLEGDYDHVPDGGANA